MNHDPIRAKFEANLNVDIGGIAKGLGYADGMNISDRIMAHFDEALQAARRDERIFWLKYIQSRAEYELHSNTFQIADMLKTDAEVAKKKLALEEQKSPRKSV